ncbi:MAG TPA: hypothetical protein VJB65_04265, partial [Patescibacteria group bacterium]|nr:hypothetical protein [Patescibacteria group bacterium]
FLGQERKKTLTIAGVSATVMRFDHTNPSIMYLGTLENGIFKTDSAGEQWRQLPINAGRIRDIIIDPTNATTVYAVINNNIIQSTDGGEQWDEIYTDTQGAIITRLSVDTSNPKRIIAGTSIGTLLISENAGINWKVLKVISEPIIGVISNPQNNQILYVLELDTTIHKSVDGGNTWTDLFTTETFEQFKKDQKAGGAHTVKRFTMDPNHPDTLYVVTADGIIKTTNGGMNWSFVNTLIERGAEQNAEIQNIVIHPKDSNTLFLTVGHLIHVTHDGGNTWSTIADFPSSGIITTCIIHPENTDILYAGVQVIKKKRTGFFVQPPTK